MTQTNDQCEKWSSQAMRKAIITAVTGLMFMVVCSGCATWTDKPKNKDSMWSSMQFWKKPYQKPAKLAAIWTHDILTMTGKPPTRGFGGRLYFYNDKSQAISVDGELVVHGYEEPPFGQQRTEKTKADKTFMFTAEQFTQHFSPSDLGASYSVWIPWDAAEGMQKEITLIPTFKDKAGVFVQGEPAKLVLPGKKIEEPLLATPFQQVSFQQSQTPTNMGPLPQPSGLRTTTISMPTQAGRGARDSRGNTSQYNTSTGSVVVGDTIHQGVQAGGLNSSMMYAGTPQAANAMTLYSALANQANANAMVQQASMPMNTQAMNPVAPYPSTMPHMLPSQLPPTQQNAMQQYPVQQYPAQPNAGLPQPNLQYPNMQPQYSPMPMAPSPSGVSQPNAVSPMHPGVASSYSTLQPGAVQAAFSATPQWQQWQPFGQAQANTAGANQVQPAAFNAGQPGFNGGLQAGGQSQAVLPGQPVYQR
jgi:hypothetical protein